MIDLPELEATSLLECLPDAVVVIEPDLRIAWWNAAAARLFAWTGASGAPRTLEDLYWEPAEGKGLALADRAALAGSASTRALRTRAGERRLCVIQACSFGPRVAFVIREAEARDDAVERLVRSESALRATLESWPDPVCIHQRGRVVYANRALCETWRGSLAQLIGLPVLELVAPADREMVAARVRAMAVGAVVAPMIDEQLMRRDGSVWVAQVSSVPMFYDGQPSVVVSAHDRTENRKLRARLDQADRMVALGTLAAGVAHEIGNPLTYVLLRLDAAQLRLAELRRTTAAARPTAGARPEAAMLDDLGGHLAAVADGARRVRAIVGDLKIFSRADDERVELDILAPLERALTMAHHELRDVALERAYQPAPMVLASDARLTQVFLNLVLNAIHAIRAPGAGPGPHRIRIEVGIDGAQVRAAVIDTGCGLEPDELPRIFDPFYTSKAAGDGVGLGLAISHSIVTGLRGDLRVDSAPGSGTCFTVVLPAA